MATPSFPDVHVTGPVHHYIRAARGSDPNVIYYLGACEVTPQVQSKKYTKPAMNTIAGAVLPLQKTYQGNAATVSALLTYFSKSAITQILESDNASGNTPIAGTESRWSRGHLVFGQSTFELWQVYENFFNPTAGVVTNGLEIGYYWPQVELLEEQRLAEGTQEQQIMYVFDCQPYWVPQASHTVVNEVANERGWILYTNDPNDFPADVRVPQ